MSDVTPPKAVERVTHTGSRGNKSFEFTQQGDSDEHDRPKEDSQEHNRHVDDIALILGVPAADISPDIQQGLSNVMNEFDRQRRELDFLRKRVAFLEKISDTHPFLQVMSRHALERAITKVLNRADKASTENTFICFQIEGLESIRHTEGLSMADLIVSNCANLIKSELRASDIMGSMGGYGLGVIFTVTTYQSAEEKVGALVPLIEQKMQATHKSLRLVYGLHLLKSQDTVAGIFAAADEDLRRRF